jgi:hypothetical protein
MMAEEIADAYANWYEARVDLPIDKARCLAAVCRQVAVEIRAAREKGLLN